MILRRRFAATAAPTFTRFMTPVARQCIQQRLRRWRDVSVELESATQSEDVTRLRKEQSELMDMAHDAQELDRLETALAECTAVAADVSQEQEMRAMAIAEKDELLKQLHEVEDTIVAELLPEEEDLDATEIVLEVRAGTGGSEAQLFAQEIFGMYERHCTQHRTGWAFRVVSVAEGDVGGFREAIAVVTGPSVYRTLRFEGGVHRVQRKPLTDKTRVHTSTTTVAVLPAAPADVGMEIPETELVVETFRARGAGGQHVNTTDSAVRITHMPTGITVAIQDDRSQHKNRAQALKLVQAKVYEKRKIEQQAQRASSRRSMIGTGDRSEVIWATSCVLSH